MALLPPGVALQFCREVETKGAKLCFGSFEVCRQAREIRKHGIRIKLEDKPFEILAALLEKPGEIVTRGELRARLWPEGTFVDFDKSLTKAVNKVRTALDNSAGNPRYIETLTPGLSLHRARDHR
jgi:DNA-binding winged helix-turn-helix (wHTH) protein